ncbi:MULTISPECIES: NADPH-dependent F420 reductase [Microbacterium]|uniref:NADPH-dependent F420 reductase n=1 Tax=Microbacterium TaxID=33882 RepID=UPI0025E4E296|nr:MULTISPECIES: NADPH-dependent F420 reductase [Microbacterium]
MTEPANESDGARSARPESVGIVGGTGPAGSALAARLADVGYSVVVGSRSKYRSMEVVDHILETWPDRRLDIVPGDNALAAAADSVVIATPWDAAAITARSVSEHLHGKVVTTMSNALARVDDEFVPLIPPRGSVAASVQATVPTARVAATLQHIPATELGNLDEPLHGDVLICSDWRDATAAVAEMVGRIPGARTLDCGNLSNATAIEAFTAVLMQLNVRYRTRVALRLVGLDHVMGVVQPSSGAANADDDPAGAASAAAV